MKYAVEMGSVAMIYIPNFMKTAFFYFSVILCAEYFIQFQSHYIYSSMTTIQLLHYDTFRPLFLAVIR
jgi:hypothetical protein